MPPVYRQSEAADNDIVEILETSEIWFGRDAADRYLALIKAALADLLEDPGRAGSRIASDIDPAARIYHLRHSRHNVLASDRVKAPRHFILYKIISPDVLGVARFLHEAMDLPNQATDDYGDIER